MDREIGATEVSVQRGRLDISVGRGNGGVRKGTEAQDKPQREKRPRQGGEASLRGRSREATAEQIGQTQGWQTKRGDRIRRDSWNKGRLEARGGRCVCRLGLKTSEGEERVSSGVIGKHGVDARRNER